MTYVKAYTRQHEEFIADIAAEGATQVAAVSAAGTAVSSTAALYVDALSTGELNVAYESIGSANQVTLASNVGVHQFGLVNGTHIFTGSVIRAIKWSWACAATTATVEIKIWKRNVAGATGAGTLNNAAPIATHDTLLGTFTTTPGAIGITPGTSNPTTTSAYTLPVAITVEAGFDLMFQFRNLDGTSAVVNCGYMTFIAAAGTQRRAGFQANTATPTTFTAFTTTRSPAITVFTPKQKSTLPATDAMLRSLIDQGASETLAGMNQRNVQNLYINATLFPNALANPASFWGDSLTYDNIGAPALPGPGFKATDVADTVTTGTVNNYGINGQTSSQISARVSTATASELAGLNQVMMGTNDVPTAKTAAQILTDYATCASAFTNPNFLFCSAWNSGPTVAKLYDVRRGLISAYGAKALDMSAVWARHTGGSSTDTAAARRGSVPTDLTQDAVHQNQAGGLIKGYEWAAALVARNGGAPFVHDDMFGFKAGDASGTAIATVRTLGSGYNWRILAGNEDGAVQIARGTGAITRTANAVLQPYRELFVEAENNKGRGRNGRIILVQQMDGTNPQKAVKVLGNGASYAMAQTSFAPADGTQATIVMCMRADISKTTGNLIAQNGAAGILFQQNNGHTLNARDAAGVSRGIITLTPQDPSQFHFYFFTINTATGVIAGAWDENATTGTATAGNLSLATWNTFFTNGGNSLPWFGDLKMLAIYDTYYDVTNAAVRANWYDSVTRLPKDIGNGSAGGALTVPLVYLRGMAGDYLLGKNFGSGGDLNVPVPVGRGHLGFADIEV